MKEFKLEDLEEYLSTTQNEIFKINKEKENKLITLDFYSEKFRGHVENIFKNVLLNNFSVKKEIKTEENL